MPYVGQGKKDFWISRLFDPATNSLKIIKESPEKYKGNLAISVFFHFSPDFVHGKLFQSMYIILSDQDGSFDTHIGVLNYILCHLASIIKCHKIPFYDIL